MGTVTGTNARGRRTWPFRQTTVVDDDVVLPDRELMAHLDALLSRLARYARTTYSNPCRRPKAFPRWKNRFGSYAVASWRHTRNFNQSWRN